MGVMACDKDIQILPPPPYILCIVHWFTFWDASGALLKTWVMVGTSG